MVKHDIVLAVKELFERHYDSMTIAKKLCVDTQLVQEIIKQLLT